MVREFTRACGTVSYVHFSDSRGGGGEVGLLTPEVYFVYEMRLEMTSS